MWLVFSPSKPLIGGAADLSLIRVSAEFKAVHGTKNVGDSEGRHPSKSNEKVEEDEV